MTEGSPRWVSTRWILLAIAPGILSDVMWAFALLGTRSHVEVIAAISIGMIYAVWLMPVVIVAYLVTLADSYAQTSASHPKTKLSFVLSYAAVDLLLWGLGVVLLLNVFRYPT
jgi:hypothetical protein